MIQYVSEGKESLRGKRVSISGSGNVAQHAALRTIQCGAHVVSLSDSEGAIVATGIEGINLKTLTEVVGLKQVCVISTLHCFVDKRILVM